MKLYTLIAAFAIAPGVGMVLGGMGIQLDDLDARRATADDVRAAPVEARQQARAEVLAQAADRSVHPSAGLPARRRHSSTTDRGGQ